MRKVLLLGFIATMLAATIILINKNNLGGANLPEKRTGNGNNTDTEKVSSKKLNKNKQIDPVLASSQKNRQGNDYPLRKLPENYQVEKNDKEEKKYQEQLDYFVKNDIYVGREDFIEETIKKLDSDLLQEIIREFNQNPDERSAKRVISSAILAGINTDPMLNVFYDEVVDNEDLLPDFVAATYNINSQNSFDKIMDLLELNFSQKTRQDLTDGILLMYNNRVNMNIVGYVDNWLNGKTHLNRSQERILISFLFQSNPVNAKKIAKVHMYKFSDKGKKKLKNKIKEIESILRR